MSITILTEAEIRSCVGLDHEALSAVSDGFTLLAAGEVNLPPIVRVDVPEYKGEVDIKTAYVRGLDSFAIKIASGFFENYRLGLPTGSGMMVVVSARTGRPEAVLLDNGYLTDVRTGAAGALAARYLAREKIDTAGVIGAGMQARYQMRGLKQVRDFRRLMIYSIIPEEVEQYAAEMGPLLGVEVVKAEGVETVVRTSVELGGTYPDIVQGLQQAKSAGSLSARFTVDALPEAGGTVVVPVGDHGNHTPT